MKTTRFLFACIVLLSACKTTKKTPNVLYQSDEFTVYADSVIQGENKAIILENNHLQSNYLSSKAQNRETKTWQPTHDLSQKPRYTSGQPLVDALFALATDEAIQNIEPDTTFRTGAKWGGVWTRDISYSIFLAFSYHEPEVAKNSLMKKVKRDRIIQDTGSGGAWPVSTDRVVWAVAAWEIYKVTGDKNWLETVFPIIKNTVEDDNQVIYDASTGLYKGESSFLDWREQSYPKWMSNKDIYESENLGTNVLHYQINSILVEMAKELGQPADEFEVYARTLKESINSNLWLANKGFYSQYLYGRSGLTASPRFETLGEALAILFEVADTNQAQSIVENAPLTTFGVPCFYPQIPGIEPYHNNAIWPFVQAYWNLAAAKSGNEAVLTHGLASIYRAAALFLTNYENMVADNGDFEGTAINSDHMLWSMAGNLAMVNRVLMGLNFETNGIRFNPVIPEVFGGAKKLENFKYRNAVLTIEIEGFGNKMASIKLDGDELENGFLPATLDGEHTIKIVMNNKNFGLQKAAILKNHVSLDTPELKRIGSELIWTVQDGAKSYVLYKNGTEISRSNATSIQIDTNHFAEYKVSALDALGWESFTSEPLLILPKSKVQYVQFEAFNESFVKIVAEFSGKGYVVSTLTENIGTYIELEVEKEGFYSFDIRYANGSGPWNTENKCALRTFDLDLNYVGTFVFPQRGTDAWDNWDYSNSLQTYLTKGKHDILIRFRPWNNNMNVEINTVYLDQFRVIYMGE